MPEKNTVEGTHDQGQETQPPLIPQAPRSSSMPVILASLALLLAAFALAVTLNSNKDMGVRQPPGDIQAGDIQGKLSTMERRVDQMEASMATNKRDLVQAKLKNMLLNLRELSYLGDNKTMAEIAKAEAILRRLSSREIRIEARVDLQSTEHAATPERTVITAVPSGPEKPAEVSNRPAHEGSAAPQTKISSHLELGVAAGKPDVASNSVLHPH